MMIRLLAVTGLASLGAVLAADLWIDHVGRAKVYRSVESVPPRPVAIVLGARVYSNGNPSLILEDRLATALDLYRAGKVQRILVSGDHASLAYDEPNTMRRWLVKRGVPDAHVFMDHAGFRTLDTMDRAAKVFLVERAVVCTQQFHLHRALFLARRAGIDAVGVAANRRVYSGRRQQQVREHLAKAMAFADSYLLGTRARFRGTPIPIVGNGYATHDASTRYAERKTGTRH